MDSRFLNFVLVLACAALIGLGPLRAQNPTSNSDANGNAVTAPASAPNADRTRGKDATADSQKLANTAVANDRDTNSAEKASSPRFSGGWLGLFGLLGLLGLIRRRGVQSKNSAAPQAVPQSRENYPTRRAA